MLNDSFRHQGLRRKLVQELREKGIINERVLNGIERVPRHVFLDPAFLEYAYQDKAFPIACGQTISQPFTVAFQTQLLDPQPGEQILEIGTGSGYQSAVLMEMGVRLYSIERHKDLFTETSRRLEEIWMHSAVAGSNSKIFRVKASFGDGFKGLPAFAPFDKVIVTCGAPEIPKALVDQLKSGGLMVIPLGAGATQTMTTVLKKANGELEIIPFADCKFVPMLNDKAR